MSNHPHIAILLASKNGARFLPDQLESFLWQNLPASSLIVSDDDSRDNSVGQIKKFATRSSLPTVLRRGPNKGAAQNFLSLIRACFAMVDYAAMSDRDELTRAELRLKATRRSLTEFRASSRIVDPSADLEGQLGLMAILQEQMADAQIALNLLQESSTNEDPRLLHAERRVAVVSSLLEDERRKFGLTEEGYAKMTGVFEDLQVEVEYAQESYLLARSALDAALKAAQSKGRFLAVHIGPVRPETPELPHKGRTLLAGFVALFLVWAVSALAVQGFRDRL